MNWFDKDVVIALLVITGIAIFVGSCTALIPLEYLR